MKLVRLSPDVFDRVVVGTKMQERARDFAREVLVDGKAQSDVAVSHGVKKQWVNRSVGAVSAVYFKQSKSTEGADDALVEIQVTVPGVIAQELTRFAQAFDACLDADSRSSIIERVARTLQHAASRLEGE
ncbi:TrfB-related DNA-binding protein [Nitrogeniibacter aestuarii]|uniref:TrfB-related DNA-binding protein n=1 Tax=Nitrogeniibacter aestuarii TaxID=2815343 RepID=UPI001E47C517|nr:TrfB-related DNA-binding protein [Nitrogeniibacter aestuarii]